MLLLGKMKKRGQTDKRYSAPNLVSPFSQCGNFKIFVSLRFYVKFNFVDSRSAKTSIFAILGAVNFVNLENFSLPKVQKFIKIKIQSL